jgi:oxygen-dependent protoporphyrinogen oxidase
MDQESSPSSIAILGGGITGLTAAFHLSRRFPKCQITLIEKRERVGGWIESYHHPVNTNGARVLLEAGPRTLRPKSKALLELVTHRFQQRINTYIESSLLKVNLLGLKDSVIKVPLDGPA